MKCPCCAFQSPYAALRCPGCQTIFDTDALETLTHLIYLRGRLEQWRAEGVLQSDAALAALAATDRETSTLLASLMPASFGPATWAPSVAPEVQSMPAAIVPLTPAGHGPVEAAPPVHAAPFIGPEDLAAAASAPAPAETGTIPIGTGAPATAWAATETADSGAVPFGAGSEGSAWAGAGPGASAEPLGGPVGVPPGPSFAWRDVGTYLLSERTLHGLLALGALLILASGVVISTLNPTGLGPLAHLTAVVATTLLFFLAGYGVRQRLHLTIAGATLLGIAGAFVPLTIWTLGQERLLDWEMGAIWLAASLVSLPLYLAAQRILRDRTFALLAALAGGSELLAALNWLGVPPEWGLAALVLLASGYLRLGVRLAAGSDALAWALRWSARGAVPVIMALLLLAKLGSDAWLVMMGRSLGGWHEYAIGAGWWLGTLFYVQGARLFGRRTDLYAAAWTLPVAYLLTLTRAPWEAAWYNACLAVLALGYLLVGYVRRRRAGSATLPPTYGAVLADPLFQVAIALAVFALLWPLQIAESRIATVFLLAGQFFTASLLLSLRVPAWIAVTLLGTAYGLTLEHLAVTAESRPLAWTALAAALLVAGEIAVRQADEARRSLLATIFGGRPHEARRSPIGAPLFAAGYLVCLLALGLAIGGYWQAPAQGGVRRLTNPAVLGWVALLATLVLSSIARRTALFLYPVAWLALIPFTASAANLFETWGTPLREPDLARLLAGWSFVYLSIGWLADRGDGRYARPLYLASYLLLPAAMLLSLLDRTATLHVVGFAILVYAGSAALVHVDRLPSFERLVVRLCGSDTSVAARTMRSLFQYLAVWLVPAWAIVATSLAASPLIWYAYVLSGLALGYPAIGLWMRRVRPEYRWPWYLGGYALSAIAPLVALPDATFRPIVLGLSIGLYVASAVVGRRSGWLYPVAVLLPILLWQALGSLGLFERWYGTGLVTLGIVYGALGIGLHRIGTSESRLPIRGRIGAYGLPFLVVGYVLSALGLARAANQERELVILAFGLAAAQYAASAWVFRQWPFAWPTAALATVAIIAGLAPYDRGVGVGLVGLAIGYGIVGVGLHLVVTGQRRLPIRGWGSAYSLPFFVIGYTLGLAGLARASQQVPAFATLAFGMAGVQYAATAAVFRQPIFGWVAAVLVAVTYGVGLKLTPLEPVHYGLGLLPAGIVSLLLADLLRRRADRPADVEADTGADTEGVTGTATAPTAIWPRLALGWALPWYVLACFIAAAMPLHSATDQRVWALAWWSTVLLLGLATLLTRRPGWLYPTLAAGMVAYVASAYVVDPTLSAAKAAASMVALAWLFLALAEALERWRPPTRRPGAMLGARLLQFMNPNRPVPAPTSADTPEGEASGVADEVRVGEEPALPERFPDARHPFTGIVAWTLPLHLAGWLALILACLGSVTDARAGLWAAGAGAVLLIVLATIRRDTALAWAGLAVTVLACEQGLRTAAVAVRLQPPYWAGASLVTVLLAQLCRYRSRPILALWAGPLSWTSVAIAIGAGALGLVVLVVQVVANTFAGELIQVQAFTVAIVGLTAITHAVVRRERRLIYLGTGLLLVGYLLELLFFEVGQPQVFALPVGIYLLTVAYVEWRRGAPRVVKRLLEVTGLALLLGVSLIQAIGFLGAGYDRYAYDTFLLLECAALLGLGAVLRWRYTFFGGALMLVVDVGILLVDPLRSLNAWYLAGIIGLALIGGVIWIEQKRQQIPLWLEAWRGRLERWD